MVTWPYQERLARAIYGNLPLEVIQLFLNPEYKGGPLIILEKDKDSIRPSAATLAKNYV